MAGRLGYICAAGACLLMVTAAHAATAPSTAKSAAPEPPVAAEAVPQVPAGRQVVRVDVVIGHGDNIYSILDRHHVDGDSAMQAIEAVEQDFDVRRLRPGDHVVLSFDRRHEKGRSRPLVALHLDTGHYRDLTVIRAEDGSFLPVRHKVAGLAKAVKDAGHTAPAPAKLEHLVVRRVEGSVDRRIELALRTRHVPEAVITDLVSALAFDPDVPASPKHGTKFKILYSVPPANDKAGRRAQLLLAELTHGRRVHHLYRYNSATARDPVFVDDRGHAVTPFKVRKPLAVARVTSPFGWRIHPVLDRPEFHKGVDYGAPPGTPVHASAPGRVVEAHWHGNYGLMVRLDHGDHMETTYSHLKRLAVHLKVGQRVAAGQVIGYVGSTGLSTGPHLYFEVFKDGKPVNPLVAERGKAFTVKPVELKKIKQEMNTLEQLASAAR